jgi:putative exosortase-associated protein (TIGR04073 family)
MKNLFLIALSAFAIASTAFGDIQSPPGHHYNWSRKLSRGLGGVIFSPLEYPDRWRQTLKQDGPVAAVSDMFVEGTKRMIVRIGYGAYEIGTFPFPSWKLTYRPAFYRKEYVDNWWGYKEFPNDVGCVNQTNYSRSQRW